MQENRKTSLKLKDTFDIRLCAEWDDESISYAIGTEFPVSKPLLEEAFQEIAKDEEMLGPCCSIFFSLYSQRLDGHWDAIHDDETQRAVLFYARVIGAFIEDVHS